MLTLTLKDSTPWPMEMTGFVPDLLIGRSTKQIEKISIAYGNHELPLGELFTAKGSISDEKLTLVGDLHAAVGIGAEMKSGLLRIDGDAGHDVGLGMWGGEIEVTGNVAANLGAEMRGGAIRLQGSAGANIGGALPGSPRGMTGGTILVNGDAGDFVGRRMRRGLIAIRGKAGNCLAHGMLAGSIIAGECGTHPGAEMSRGTVCLSEPNQVVLLPTFPFACTAHVPVLGMLGRQLQSLGFENDLWNANRRWQQFSGDQLISGRGELFIAQC